MKVGWLLVLLAWCCGARAEVVPGGLVSGHFDGTGVANEYSLTMTVEHDPGQAAYFWANQFRIDSVIDHGGYFGMQSRGYLGNGQWGRLFIFSIWNAVEGQAAPGGQATPFDGEGVGWSLRRAYAWEAGVPYTFTLVKDGQFWWHVVITAPGMEAISLGRIRVTEDVPLFRNSSVFTEYYLGVPDCAALPFAQATFSGATYGGVPSSTVAPSPYGPCATNASGHVRGGSIVHRTGLAQAPVPAVSILDTTVSEGNSGKRMANFLVRLSAPTATSSTTFTLATSNGTAQAGSDYVARSLAGIIPAGNVASNFAVEVMGDTTIEPSETFHATLADVVGMPVLDGQATAVIANDDFPVLSVGDVSVAEGQAGTKTATLIVRLDRASPTAVGYSIATGNATATAGSDYVARALSGQQIPAGALARTFAVTLNGDAAVEANETFKVSVSAVTGAIVGDGQATGTLVNDDVARISVGDVALAEGQAGTRTASFAVRLDRTSLWPVTFSIATVDGSAVAGVDYIAASTTAQQIPPGALARTFLVTVHGDTTIEATEAFHVNLANVSGATVLDGAGAGTLVNDDFPQLSVGDVTLAEGDSGMRNATFILRLDRVSTLPVKYTISSADGSATAGSDYTATGAAGQFPPGALSRTFVVPVHGDLADEPTETFKAVVSGVSGAVVAKAEGIATVADDD